MKVRKILNSDDIKTAIEKGKALKLEVEKRLQAEKEERAKKDAEEARRVEALLQGRAQYLLDSMPGYITSAVMKGESSFVLTACKDSDSDEYWYVTKILKPKLEELGLSWFEDSSREWEIIRYDPPSDYEFIMLRFNVRVPE